MTSPMLVAIATNVLAYADSVGDEARRRQAVALLTRLPEHAVVLPAQVLGELFRVLVGKLRQKPEQAREGALRWSDAYAVRDSNRVAMQSAFDPSIWDPLILSVAAEQRCRLLLSEDLKHGFTWRGATVVNPFKHPAHALLEEVLEAPAR